MRKSVWRLMALAVAMAPLTIGTSYAQSLSDLANDTATPGQRGMHGSAGVDLHGSLAPMILI